MSCISRETYWLHVIIVTVNKKCFLFRCFYGGTLCIFTKDYAICEKMRTKHKQILLHFSELNVSNMPVTKMACRKFLCTISFHSRNTTKFPLIFSLDFPTKNKTNKSTLPRRVLLFFRTHGSEEKGLIILFSTRLTPKGSVCCRVY